MFFENASLNGLKTVSNCIEDKLNIYLKLFALLYAAKDSNRAEVFWIKWIAFIFVYWFYITYKPNVGHYTRVKRYLL
jgi:hypothetical protein